MPELVVDKRRIPYTVKRSRRTKSVRITAGVGGIQVIAPYSLSAKQIALLVEEKRKWIAGKFNYFNSLSGLAAERNFTGGEELLYLGKKYVLEIAEGEGPYITVDFTGRQFKVLVGRRVPPGERGENIRLQLEKWYLSMARRVILGRLEYYKQRLGVEFNDVHLKNQKTRWGSCSAKRNLNFNWRLVMAPDCVLDYVVVHELCHLQHMNHSRAFWQLVEGEIPDYKSMRKWLRHNGALLAW